MDNKYRLILLLFMAGGIMIISCQKELRGIIADPAVAVLKPKVGTVWIYRYYTYRSIDGGIATSDIVKYVAQNEKIITGEKWLNIVEVGPDTTVYFLQENIDGLYQYTNNNKYLFCKFPAVLNDTYNSFNRGSAEDFIVKGTNDTLTTGIGDVPVNFYEGNKGGLLKDWIWYHKNAWIVRHYVFLKFPLGVVTYRYSGMFLQSIVY